MSKELKHENPVNAFENYPALAERLLHAAHHWKVDDTWSKTLAEINNVCAELNLLKQQTASMYSEDDLIRALNRGGGALKNNHSDIPKKFNLADELAKYKTK